MERGGRDGVCDIYYGVMQPQAPVATGEEQREGQEEGGTRRRGGRATGLRWLLGLVHPWHGGQGILGQGISQPTQDQGHMKLEPVGGRERGKQGQAGVERGRWRRRGGRRRGGGICR